MDALHCFQCEAKNPPGQPFCGHCGSALKLSEYIASRVKHELDDATRDREILETESAINVFERAWKWMRLAVGIFVGAGGLAIGVVLAVSGWQAADFLKTVKTAKQSVIDTSKQTEGAIKATSQLSVGEIQKASSEAIDANRTSSEKAAGLSKSLETTAAKTKSELNAEASSVRTDVASSKAELEQLKKLQPEFNSMRMQLAKATSDLADQQKVISNSEDFVKHVFSSHVNYYFDFTEFIQPNHSIVIPSTGNGKSTVVFMLVPDSPIDGTLQLQQRVAVQPVGSFLHIHNLILFFWGDPAAGLRTQPLSVSYFPDKSDKDLIKSLTFRDGRGYADDQPFPKFGQTDPDWKGNKWMPLAQQPTAAKPEEKAPKR